MSIWMLQNLTFQSLSADFPDSSGERVIIPDQPTEFPTHDPGHWLGYALHSPLFWLLLYLLALVLLFMLVHRASRKAFIKGRALWVGDRVNLWLGAKQDDTGIEWIWKYVDRKLRTAWQANPNDKRVFAESAYMAYETTMRNTLTLSREINKAMGGVKKAVEGQKEVDPPYSPHGFSAGGAVINIAVNQGNSVSAQGDASQSNYAGPLGPEPHGEAKHHGPMSEVDQRQAIWKVIDKLYDYWKGKAQILALFAGAQKQLTQAVPWSPPNPLTAGGSVDELSPAMRKLVHAKWKKLRMLEEPPEEFIPALKKMVHGDIFKAWQECRKKDVVPDPLIQCIANWEQD